VYDTDFHGRKVIGRVRDRSRAAGCRMGLHRQREVIARGHTRLRAQDGSEGGRGVGGGMYPGEIKMRSVGCMHPAGCRGLERQVRTPGADDGGRGRYGGRRREECLVDGWGEMKLR
jgi:hypothetical protein